MSWKVVQIKTFLHERKGRYKPNDADIKGLKRIEKIDFSGNIFLSDKPSKTDMILIKEGDLVISGINVEKGAMSIYKGKEDVVATIHYSSYQYNLEKIDLDFLRHFLKSPEFLEALKEQVPGGIKTEIKPKHILPLNVCVPTDVTEQRKVVEYLDKQNNTIETQSTELTHQLNLVKQLRQAFLREAMQGKLVPQDPNDEPASVLLEKIKAEKERLIKEKKIKKQKPLPPITEDEIPFEIPENWVWCNFGELCELINGDRSKNYPNRHEYVDEGIPWINTGHIETNGTLSVSKMHYITENKFDSLRSGKIQDGDLVYCLRGATFGKTAFVKPYTIGAIASSLMIIRLFSGISNEYVYYFLKSDFAMQQLYRFNNGSAQPNLAAGDVRLYHFPLPPLSEQQRIVAKLDELMAYCDKLEASIKESQQQNELLLQQVLREALEPKEKEVV